MSTQNGATSLDPFTGRAIGEGGGTSPSEITPFMPTYRMNSYISHVTPKAMVKLVSQAFPPKNLLQPLFFN